MKSQPLEKQHEIWPRRRVQNYTLHVFTSLYSRQVSRAWLRQWGI